MLIQSDPFQAYAEFGGASYLLQGTAYEKEIQICIEAFVQSDERGRTKLAGENQYYPQRSAIEVGSGRRSTDHHHLT